MGFWSRVGNFCSSVGSSITRTASAVFNKAKEVAGKAIGWMAEKAEGFVSTVKNVWQTVKPYVAKAQAFIKAAANAAPYLWLKTALLALDKGITALFAFENLPIAKKIDAAIKWAINLAKRWHASRQKAHGSQQDNTTELDEELTDEELATAKKHQETFRTVEREVGDGPERETCELASAINDFKVAKAELVRALAGEPANFEHFLRLRATQKLLNLSEKMFIHAKTIDDLSMDDLFLVRIAANLVKADPELSIDAAMRLDRVLVEKYRTTLMPFVFEEMVASWALIAKDLSAQWNNLNRQFAKDTVVLKRLTLNKNLEGDLSKDEELELARLQKEVPIAKGQMEAIAIKRRDIERYVGAIEGFLQLLEKTSEEIEAEDRSYLIEEGATVGMILMRCAQEDIAFKDLNPEEQELITDYANIYKKEADIRMEKVLEVTA